MFLYLPYDTVLHRIHPATKIVGLFLMLVMTVGLTEAWQQLIVLTSVLTLAATGRAFRNIRRILPLVITVMLFSCITWSLFKRVGDPFWTAGPLTLSRESIEFGVAMAFRLNAMLLSGMIFVTCTRVEEFSYGLRALGLPFPVSFALSLAFRLVPLFFSRIGIIVQAQQSRGLDLKSGNLVQRIPKYIPLLVPIFVYAIRDTDLLAMALESKGFGFRTARTEYLRFVFGWSDGLIIGMLITINTVIWMA